MAGQRRALGGAQAAVQPPRRTAPAAMETGQPAIGMAQAALDIAIA